MNRFLPAFLLLPFSAISQQDTLEEKHPTKTSVETLKATVVYKEPNIWAYSSNFTNALTVGQTGVYTTSSGAPGSDIGMTMRSYASQFGYSNTPLVMVDGMPYYGDYAAINTYHIESISVEKIPADFSAPLTFSQTGIIHIHTKKAPTKPSRWYVNLNANVGFSSRAIPQYDIITDPGAYSELFWQGSRKDIYYGGAANNWSDAGRAASDNMFDGGYDLSNPFDVPNNKVIDPATGKLNPNASLKYKDNWPAALQRLGALRQFNVGAGKSWKKADVYLSGNYVKDDGYMIQSSFERIGTNLQAHLRPVDGLEIGVNGSYSTHLDQVLPSGSAYINPFYALYNTPPTQPVYLRDADGNIMTDPATGDKQYAAYPINIHIVPQLKKLSNYMRYHNAYINPSLKYTIISGLDVSVQGSYFKRDKLYLGHTGIPSNISTNTILQPKLRYNRHWANHTLNVAAEYFWMKSVQTSKNEPQPNGVWNFTNRSVLTYGTAMTSFAYAYNNRLKINAQLQKVLGRSPQSQPYDNSGLNGAASASWMQPLGIYNLTLRAAYARYYETTTLLSHKQLQFASFTFVSNDYKGPLKKQTDLGATLANRSGRFTLGLNWFDKRLQDGMMIDYIAPSTSINTYYTNGLGTRHTGLELSLNAHIIGTPSFTWSMGLYATHMTATLTALKELDTIISKGFLSTTGASMYQWYAPQYAGADPQLGWSLYERKNGTKDDYQMILAEDLKHQGSNIPLIFGSLTNQFIYKNIGVQFALSYSIGGRTYDQYYQILMGGNGNYHKDLLASWTPEHTDTELPAVDLQSRNNLFSSRFFTGASWLNLKYVLLSYRLPLKLYKKSGFDNMSIYASGENLLFFSQRKGFNTNEALGTPLFSYQPMRTVRLGVNIDL